MRHASRGLVFTTVCLLPLTPVVAQLPGSPDPTFAAAGVRLVDIQVAGSPRSNIATGVLVQVDGRIVLGGAASTDGSGAQRMVAVRLTEGGALDPSFSGDGIVAIDGYPPDDGNPRFFEGHVATAPNGGIYLHNGVVDSTGVLTGWSLARLDAAGGLVAGFGSGGVIHRVDLEVGVGDLAARSDGRPIVLDDFLDEGGTVPNYEWSVARFLTDGDPDPTYGDQGSISFGFDPTGTRDDFAFPLVLQADGKTVAGGSADVGAAQIDDDFAVARLTTGGVLDASFSGDGRVTFGFGATDEAARAVAVDSKRRTLVSGTSAGNCALARLRADGTLDPTFSGDGRLTFSFASDLESAFDQGFAVVPQGDGRIIVVGRATNAAGTGRRVGVARINEDGSFDATFSSLPGRPGRQIFDWATGTGAVSVGRAVTLAVDGRILVVGGAEHASGDMDFVVGRLHNDYVFADGFEWGGFGAWSSHVD